MGGGSSSTTSVEIPQYMHRLFAQSAGGMTDLQKTLPLTGPSAYTQYMNPDIRPRVDLGDSDGTPGDPPGGDGTPPWGGGYGGGPGVVPPIGGTGGNSKIGTNPGSAMSTSNMPAATSANSTPWSMPAVPPGWMDQYSKNDSLDGIGPSPPGAGGGGDSGGGYNYLDGSSPGSGNTINPIGGGVTKPIGGGVTPPAGGGVTPPIGGTPGPQSGPGSTGGAPDGSFESVLNSIWNSFSQGTSNPDADADLDTGNSGDGTGANTDGGDYSYTGYFQPQTQYGAGTAPGDPFSQGTGSDWVPQTDGGYMSGGGFGFVAPNAQRVAGASQLQNEAVNAYGEGLREGNQHRYDANSMLQNSSGILGNIVSGDKHQQRLAKDAAGGAMWNTRKMLQNGAPASTGQASAMYDNMAHTLGKRVSPQTIQNNAMVAAKRNEWEATQQPQLENSFDKMGLARSGALGGALSDSWAKNVMPVMEEETAREERRIERQGQGWGQAAAGKAQVGRDVTDRNLALVNQLQSGAKLHSDLYSQDLARNFGVSDRLADNAGQLVEHGQSAFDQHAQAGDAAWEMGSGFRDIAQEGNEATYEDFLRRQGLAENALYTPFSAIGSTFGQTTSGGK